MNHKKWSVLLSSVLVGTVFIPSLSLAGNVKKLYVNLSKDGLQAQASDIPANYNQIEVKFKNVAYESRGYHGTYVNNPLKSEGKFGSSLLFNGSNNINLALNLNDTSFNFTDNFTIECWIKSPELSSHAQSDLIVHRYWWTLALGTPQGGIRLYDNSGHGAYTKTAVFSNNRWHHVAAVKSGNVNSIKIYIDGKLQSLNYVSDWTPAKRQAGIEVGGSSTSNGYFKGNVDELRIWSVARTQKEIEEHMNHPLQGNEVGLAAYWSFDN